MPWLFGLLGAIFGAYFASAERGLFGMLIGGLLGVVTVGYLKLRTRVAELSERLDRRDRIDAAIPAARQTAAAPAPAPAPPNVAAAPPPAAAEVAMQVEPVAPAFEPLPVFTPEPATPAAPPPRPSPARAPAPSVAAARAMDAAPDAAPEAAAATAAYRREPTLDDRIAATLKRWLFEGNLPVKIGVVFILFTVGWLLRWLDAQGLLNMPIELRMAGIATAALAGLLLGWRERRRRPTFGLALQGGAIGVLLLTVFAAFGMYKLLPAGAAFALVVVLVAGAALLAVLQNAVALAVLGFTGGYLAPVLISTGSGNHVVLFSFYAVLNAAVLAIAMGRSWRWLNLLGFAFTFLVGLAWGQQYYRPELLASVEPFLILFFLFYLAIPVLYALRQPAARRGFVDGTLVFGTPLLAFPLQAALLRDNDLALAFSALALAAIYGVLAWWLLRAKDLKLLGQSFAALALGFATLAVPLALSARWTSAVWALQGAGLVWLGVRQNSRLREWSGWVLTVLAAIAYLLALPGENWIADFAVHGMTDGWRMFGGHALSLVLLAVGGAIIADTYSRASDSGRESGAALAWWWALVWLVLALWVALPSRLGGLSYAVWGALLAWLALNRSGRMHAVAAFGLSLLAGAAWLLVTAAAPDGIGWQRAVGELPIANTETVTLLLMALSGWFIARLYDRDGAARPIAWATFAWGLAWWLLAGLREADAGIAGLPMVTALAAFAAVTALLAGLLRAPLDWPRPGWLVVGVAVVGAPLAFVVDMQANAAFDATTWMIWLGWLLAVCFGLWRLREPLQRGLSWAHIGMLATVVIVVGTQALRLARDDLLLGSGWQIPIAWLLLVLLFWGTWRQPRLFAQPLFALFPRYRMRWFALAGSVLGVVWLLSQFDTGRSAPLPFIPLLNPLELFQVLLLALLLRFAHQEGPRVPIGLIAVAGFLMLTMVTLRGTWQLTLVADSISGDWDWVGAALNSRIAQTALTVTWSLAGVSAWIVGSKRRNRKLWLAGAVLMGIVMGKVLLIDRTYTGDLAGIVSFGAVGLLLLLVGYLAPSPPKSEPQVQA